MTQTNTNRNQHDSRHRGRPFWGIALLIGAVVFASLFALGSRRRPWGHADWFHASSVEDLRGHLEHVTRWSLRKTRANDDQQKRIQAIVADLAPELFQLQNERQALRDRFTTAVQAGQVNPQELEAIRADSIRLADRSSAQMLHSLLPALQVLKPEQRRELLEQWGSRL